MSELSKRAGKPRRLRGSIVVTLLVSLAALPALASKAKSSGEEHASPKLVLSSSMAVGFVPVTVRLVATLKGIDPEDTNFCHATVTWVRVDPGPSPQTETRTTEAPRCVHANGESSVTTTLDKSFDLDNPGTYLYQVWVTAKNGKEIRSNYVSVRAVRVQ